MNPHRRVYPIVLLGYWNTACHVVRTAAVADRNNPVDSGIPGTLHHSIAVRFKTRIIQMSMRVD
jgi:hypothetical protein